MSKFKVGDRVRTTSNSDSQGNYSGKPKGYEYIIKEIHGIWHRSEINKYDGVREEELELVEEQGYTFSTFDKNKYLEQIYKHYLNIDLCTDYQTIINKKSIMTNIKTFVKNLALSADEKALRKVGFKTDCGEYTQEAIDVVLQDLCKEKEANLIEIANGIVAEEKK